MPVPAAPRDPGPGRDRRREPQCAPRTQSDQSRCTGGPEEGSAPPQHRPLVNDGHEQFLATGVLDDDREEMASKLGTSEYMDLTRMTATMGEFDVARLLVNAGYDIEPEIEVSTDHVIDFRATRGDGRSTLVEVTRPVAPNKRAAGTPSAAVRDTVQTKTSGQLEAHGGGVTLFVDCSSFPDDDWFAVRGERPEVGHRPAVVFRSRPDGSTEAYRKGSVPLELDAALEWV